MTATYHPLRLERMRRALTLERLGQLTGLSRETIRRIETWERYPQPRTRERLLRALEYQGDPLELFPLDRAA